MSMQQVAQPHPMPVIGHPEIFYVKHIKQAEETGAFHAREAYKVGRYVTLAIDPKLPWEEKIRYFKHVLKHHVTAPDGSDPETQQYYHKLLDLVKRYASQEAVKSIKHESDRLREMRQRGESLEKVRIEAGAALSRVIGDHAACPHWMRPDAWEQVKMIQRQWA
jgi:hypothetical protein